MTNGPSRASHSTSHSSSRNARSARASPPPSRRVHAARIRGRFSRTPSAAASAIQRTASRAAASSPTTAASRTSATPAHSAWCASPSRSAPARRATPAIRRSVSARASSGGSVADGSGASSSSSSPSASSSSSPSAGGTSWGGGGGGAAAMDRGRSAPETRGTSPPSTLGRPIRARTSFTVAVPLRSSISSTRASSIGSAGERSGERTSIVPSVPTSRSRNARSNPIVSEPARPSAIGWSVSSEKIRRAP